MSDSRQPRTVNQLLLRVSKELSQQAARLGVLRQLQRRRIVRIDYDRLLMHARTRMAKMRKDELLALISDDECVLRLMNDKLSGSLLSKSRRN